MEIYVSTDIEADGPIPGENSMLSFGSAAFCLYKNNIELIDIFSVNLLLLQGAKSDPETMKFWKKNEKAYIATRTNQRNPLNAMRDYEKWLDTIKTKKSKEINEDINLVFVGYPAGFDFTFIYWYLTKFLGKSPFSFSAIDIKTYAMALMKSDFRKTTKKTMPARWFSNVLHNHVALQDAIEQGYLFMNMIKENTNGNS